MQSADPPPSEWPCGGRIVFEDVSLRYRPGLPLSLVSFSATVEARQKVPSRTPPRPSLTIADHR